MNTLVTAYNAAPQTIGALILFDALLLLAMLVAGAVRVWRCR